MTTKQKIIQGAKSYFNQNGFLASSLFELAQQLDMTRGNLTYHFKTKDLLLAAISEEMWAKMEESRRRSRQLPSFENMHNETQLMYRIQKEYGFILLDNHVLNHPVIKEPFRKMTQQIIADYQAAIAFSISTGNLKPEPLPGLYHNIAFIAWMLTFYFLSQQIGRGEKTGEDGEKMIWSILLPHFTDKGLQAFKSFFGDDYINTLGKPFDLDLSKLVSF